MNLPSLSILLKTSFVDSINTPWIITAMFFLFIGLLTQIENKKKQIKFFLIYLIINLIVYLLAIFGKFNIMNFFEPVSKIITTIFTLGLIGTQIGYFFKIDKEILNNFSFASIIIISIFGGFNRLPLTGGPFLAYSTAFNLEGNITTLISLILYCMIPLLVYLGIFLIVYLFSRFSEKNQWLKHIHYNPYFKLFNVVLLFIFIKIIIKGG